MKSGKRAVTQHARRSNGWRRRGPMPPPPRRSQNCLKHSEAQPIRQMHRIEEPEPDTDHVRQMRGADHGERRHGVRPGDARPSRAARDVRALRVLDCHASRFAGHGGVSAGHGASASRLSLRLRLRARGCDTPMTRDPRGSSSVSSCKCGRDNKKLLRSPGRGDQPLALSACLQLRGEQLPALAVSAWQVRGSSARIVRIARPVTRRAPTPLKESIEPEGREQVFAHPSVFL
jgi:hypothetical protein